MINIVISYKNKKSLPKAKPSLLHPPVLRFPRCWGYWLAVRAAGLKPTAQHLKGPRVGLVLGALSRLETGLDFLVLFAQVSVQWDSVPREPESVGVPWAARARLHWRRRSRLRSWRSRSCSFCGFFFSFFPPLFHLTKGGLLASIT